MLNELVLFAGHGGSARTKLPLCRPIAYCESDRYSIGVLLSEIQRGRLKPAPIWDDVRTLQATMLPRVDIISAGFPCQDISLAGNRAGLDGQQSSLFWEIIRLTKETDCSLVFLENVWPGIRPYIPTIRNAFESIGYDVRDGVLSASEVGAAHIRSRWFMVAYSRRVGRVEGVTLPKDWKETIINESLRNLDPEQFRLRQGSLRSALNGGSWPSNCSVPSVPRGTNGTAFRCERINGSGNAVVPLQEELAWLILTGLGVKI
jgi:DNA (cytosine-5)-methyltransferase 1